MFKLLIADDEPLVCVGLKSMIKWEDYNIEVVDTARNGKIAKELIEKHKPDIVISDIKMPIKTGLQLIAECNKEYGRIPLFIMLTSYEEFEYVKEAINYQAIDYLIKPELTAKTLSAAILKAINTLREYNRIEPISTQNKNTLQNMKEKFFIRLYNNLFESETQFNIQRQELNINFKGKNYVVINCRIIEIMNNLSTEQLFLLCTSTSELLKEVLNKEYTTYTLIMDIRRFNITVELNEELDSELENLETLLRRSISVAYSYFNVNMFITVGSYVDNPYNLSESYFNAQKLSNMSINNNLIFYKNEEKSSDSGFVFSDVKEDLRRAFDEIDTKSLSDVLEKICVYYTENKNEFIEAIDTASNILYMTISLLPDGEKNISKIFTNEPDNYRSMYSYKTTDEIVKWLEKLSVGIIEFLSTKKKDYKEQIVESVKDYILSNLDKKLSLHDVAAVFNFNPNYLSHLFAKYSDTTFVEFTTKSKIEKAKDLLNSGEWRINEIAEKLGFDNAFYFSKVFKKYVGISPRDYQQK